MSSPFVAEIRMFGFNFPPTGWAFCNGQLMPLSQNTALFSLLGTFYGGDGKSTFALPNLQGSTPIFWGQGAGLSEYFLGQQSGTTAVTLLDSEIPIHNHSISMSVRPGDNLNPGGLALGTGNNIYATPANPKNAAFQTLTPAGGSLPHNNMMPYLALNFCIALQGVFPPRT
ncbi:MAG TPA: tail fiber protein [Allosphingosinicella sp.]|nr:tail fiber protein [Allosphingosinicella sp.]